jgi:hypothetical protein
MHVAREIKYILFVLFYFVWKEEDNGEKTRCVFVDNLPLYCKTHRDGLELRELFSFPTGNQAMTWNNNKERRPHFCAGSQNSSPLVS